MSIYKQSDGLKYVMERRWEENAEEFPKTKKDFIDKFKDLEIYLNEKHHPNVNLGAAVAGDGVLTDHGVDHVQMVIDKASCILKEKENLLKGYEIFLLLVAIHFHDLGNIYGRTEHEQKILDVMNELGDKLPLDDPEKEIVATISTAHGGYAFNNRNDKDTLRLLAHETFCNGIPVRPIVLAAVLRFADELSDDFSRSIDDITIPDGNKLFHEYSKALEPIGFNGRTLSFHYRIPYDKTKELLIKGTQKLYLYDEILIRLSKCLRELDYCRKYADGFVDITTLSINIKIKDPRNPHKAYDNDSFRLRLLGYPSEDLFRLEDYIINDENSIHGNPSRSFP